MAVANTKSGVLAGEPVAALGALASVIVFVLAYFDIVVDVSLVNSILLAIAPLATALVARSQVTPV